MEEKEKKRVGEWYFKPWVILLAILSFGPLGLLPLWFRPKTNIYLKIAISVLVFALTVWMTVEVTKVYQNMLVYYKELAGIILK